jgi:hypothetical protein
MTFTALPELVVTESALWWFVAFQIAEQQAQAAAFA